MRIGSSGLRRSADVTTKEILAQASGWIKKTDVCAVADQINMQYTGCRYVAHTEMQD